MKGSNFMKYLSNSFSVQMIKMNPDNEEIVKFKEVSLEEIKNALKGDFISAVGHMDTANILTELFEIPVNQNRISIILNKGDILYVAQLVGGRLPEGSTHLPDGFKFKFIEVTL